jgi:hypothetical protein
MGKSTISMVIFNSYFDHNQRVVGIFRSRWTLNGREAELQRLRGRERMPKGWGQPGFPRPMSFRNPWVIHFSGKKEDQTRITPETTTIQIWYDMVYLVFHVTKGFMIFNEWAIMADMLGLAISGYHSSTVHGLLSVFLKSFRIRKPCSSGSLGSNSELHWF